MTDEIRLVLPAEEDFHPVAHLVLGGLGARHSLTFDQLDDLQVALDALLGRRDDEDEIVVSIRFEKNTIRAEVGPYPAGALDELDGEGEALGLRRVLETVCDSFEIEKRDAGSWVQLQKTVA
ncbi:MAG TPA: hypothetical protein VLE97_04970 [Gaiellaceae bacterium]|nr:hypothetical protein [Gaiellaceae bacterium]